MIITYLFITDANVRNMGLGGPIGEVCTFLLQGIASGENTLSDPDANSFLVETVGSAVGLLKDDQWLYLTLADDTMGAASFAVATGSRALIESLMILETEKHAARTAQTSEASQMPDGTTIH